MKTEPKKKLHSKAQLEGENTVNYSPGDSCLPSQEGHEHVDPNDWDRKILICTHNGSGGYYWRDSGRRRSG